MNYTAKYHFPQWVESDRIMMKDFNQMCADMESGLTAVAQGAAAESSKVAADAAKAAKDAQTTADKAVADAARAQAKADAAYSPSQPPYTIGSYTGNSSSVTVNVGFRPRFLLIQGSGPQGGHYFILFGEGLQGGQQLRLTNTGFVVARNTETFSGVENEPHLVDYNQTYVYIAFR